MQAGAVVLEQFGVDLGPVLQQKPTTLYAATLYAKV